jgi:hypothetical protein
MALKCWVFAPLTEQISNQRRETRPLFFGEQSITFDMAIVLEGQVVVKLFY